MNTSRADNPNFWKNSFVSMLKTKFKYNTGIFGKMLNVMDTYGCNGTGLEDVDRSFIMCDPSFYNQTWANFTGVDGNVYTSGDSPEDYTTSMIGNASVSWIRSVVEDEKPFFAFVGLHAPHLPSTPPPYGVDPNLKNVSVPRDPIWNRLSKDKHSFLSTEPEINSADLRAIEIEHTNRLESLVAVDNVIESIVSLLREKNQWERTLFVFTSDHGYSLGQNRVDSHKTQVYDHNIRVPFIAKVPFHRNHRVMNSLISMVDVAPTILEFAGATDLSQFDGISFQSELLSERATRKRPRASLVEYQSIRTVDTMTRRMEVSAYGYRDDGQNVHIHDGPNNTFVALRILDSNHTSDLLYAEFTDVTNPKAWDFAPSELNFFELYNVTNDYYMAHNIYESVSENLRQELHNALQVAIKCKGSSDCYNALSNFTL